MIVDLTIIDDGQSLFDYRLEPNQIDLESETAKLLDVVEVKGKLRKGIVQTDFEGEISTVLEVECTRCLRKVETPLNIVFTVGFVSAEHYTKEKDAEVNVRDLEVSISDNDRINLNEIVREQILLNLPERIFCREDCSGLCQKCGANRNLVDCNCEEKEIDPRWSALKNLK